MKHEHLIQRTLEVIPALLVWITFILAIGLSFLRPVWVMYFIIIFDLYWLFRVLYFIMYLAVAWRRYRRSLRQDWYSDLKATFPNWRDYYHLVFLPMYREPYEIVSSTLDALLGSEYPNDRFIVVLAGEERAHDYFSEIAERVRTAYGNSFYRLLVTEHPSDLPDEIPAKGANINYAGHQVKRLIDDLGIDYDKVIVSTFDIDTIAHQQYFACLTYAYVSSDKPTRSSYQPVVLYNNTIWQASAPMRLAAFSTTFWLMTELVRPDRLFTFSSHSMSFRALVDVGFWQKDIVSEDSRIFFQGFFRYNGDYRVTPLYIPVSMDTVAGKTAWDGLKNLYKQQRRWAWGVEHFPYLVRTMSRNNRISFRKKLKLLWIQIEGMYTWATAPIVIFVLGRLPLAVADSHVQQSVLAQNTPILLEILLNLSMLGILVIGSMSFFLLPPRGAHVSRKRYISMFFQWALLPFSLIFFSSLPAIDAQTRLMLGKHLGFSVTEKVRGTNRP
ncbi:hypothetical protein HYV71_03900 [Candidatus Uhrbacteria bacterium]|nr:hypothetical protein [Candidatus Uhrbacteria bacterium]